MRYTVQRINALLEQTGLPYLKSIDWGTRPGKIKLSLHDVLDKIDAKMATDTTGGYEMKLHGRYPRRQLGARVALLEGLVFDSLI